MIIRESHRPGFALVQFMLVVIIITILIGVFVQMTQGRQNERVWAEGYKSANIVQQAVQSYVFDLGISQAVVRLQGQQVDRVLTDLCFSTDTLTGKNFDARAYTIRTINPHTGLCEVRVDGQMGLARVNNIKKTLHEDGRFN